MEELWTGGLDHDQIWEEIELMNQPMSKFYKKRLKYVEKISAFDDCELIHENPSDAPNIGTDIEESDSIKSNISTNDNEHEALREDYKFDHEYLSDKNEAQISDEVDEPFLSESSESPKERKSGKDMFFSMKELEKFANEDFGDYDSTIDYSKDPDEIISDNEDEDEHIDDFDESSSQDGTYGPKYDEFFDQPKCELVDISYQSDNDSIDNEKMLDDVDQVSNLEQKDLFAEPDDNDTTELTPFQKRRQKLDKKITALEEENIADKSWQLKGEATAKERPLNSLLDEDLEIEHASKPVPVITEEVTKSLEDVIKSRIIDGIYDDVERCLAPEDQLKILQERLEKRNRKFVELDDSKPKKSLSEIYEDEYQKKLDQQKSKIMEDSEKQIEKKKDHQEIEELYKDLCFQLDALSNYLVS